MIITLYAYISRCILRIDISPTHNIPVLLNIALHIISDQKCFVFISRFGLFICKYIKYFLLLERERERERERLFAAVFGRSRGKHRRKQFLYNI